MKIKSLYLDLGDFKLKDVNLNVRKGEYFAILGHTGSGKTELLKCIAGIREPERGEIWIDGRNVTELPPEEREVGYMPQDYKLFPHLTVEKNIAFGLEKKNPSSKSKVRELMDLVGVSHLSERHCTKCLSSGEQQRVSLARALAIDPKLLLLDEPLGAIDAMTKVRLKEELKRIHDKTGTTTIHITHDFEEALDLAERIAIMRNGEILQVGEPIEVLKKPNSEFVVKFTKFLGKNLDNLQAKG